MEKNLSMNLLFWIYRAKITSLKYLMLKCYLDTMDVTYIIKHKNYTLNLGHTKAVIFFRYYLDQGLKLKYLIYKNPLML